MSKKIDNPEKIEQDQLKDLLSRLESGEKTASNFYDVFFHYAMMEKYTDKEIIEKYADLTMSAAREEISLNKNPENAYMYMAKICEYRKDNKNMFLFINKAIEINPQFPDLYLVRAEFYKKTKNKKMAEHDYQHAIELDSSCLEYIEILKKSDVEIAETKKLRVVLYLYAAFMAIWLLYILVDSFFDISKFF